jgi:hypothetical protein
VTVVFNFITERTVDDIFLLIILSTFPLQDKVAMNTDPINYVCSFTIQFSVFHQTGLQLEHLLRFVNE